MRKGEIILRFLRIPFDFVSVVGAFIVAYFLRSHPEADPFFDLPYDYLLPWGDFVWFSVQAGVLLVLMIALEGGYSFQKSRKFRKDVWKIFLVMTAWVMLMVLYFFVVKVTFFSRLILGYGVVFSLVFMLAHRLALRQVQRSLWKRGKMKRRVWLLGSGAVVDELERIWRKDIAFDVLRETSPEGEDLSVFLSHRRVDEVVQVGGRDRVSEQLVEYCQLHHLEYRFIPDLLEIQRTNLEIDFVNGIPLISLRATALDAFGRVMKRMSDVAMSSIVLVVLSPLLLLIAIGVKLDSDGPVLYRSRRVSRDKEFWMWKFRTMVVGAEAMRQELVERNKRTGPLFKVVDDPRITLIGRFLRKWSLDELPQLWNVVVGDLSLVGPRAHLPKEVEQYERHHLRVLAMKAGVTGLAQVSGRSHLDFEQEVKLDVYYLENWSMWLDVWILWRTIWTVVEGKGE